MIYQQTITADGEVVCGLVNEFGNVISRTPQEYPYSYDGFITYRASDNDPDAGTIYSDRLWDWDFKRADALCQKHFGDKGQYFSNRSPKKIEAFLRDWCDDPDLKLIFIMQYCNVSSGYPVWRFEFKQTKK